MRASRLGEMLRSRLEILPVKFTTRVWARFVSFEGQRYISSLTNVRCPRAGELDSSLELVFDPHSSGPVGFVSLGQDHLGVRELLFSASDPPAIEERQGVWWGTIPLPDTDDEMLMMQTDVSCFGEE